MESQAGKSPHPLAWVAAILLIVVCGAGVGALMGWIPISFGTPAEPVLTKFEQPVAPARAAVPAPAAEPARCAKCGVVRSVRTVAARKPVESAKSYEITVGLDDGSDQVIIVVSTPAWRHGDKVRIVNGVIESDA